VVQNLQQLLIQELGASDLVQLFNIIKSYKKAG